MKDFRAACDYISVPEKRNNETDRRTRPKPTASIKQRHAFNTFLATALISIAAVTTQAQTWETLLPSPTVAYPGSGFSALIDPFSANSANPGVFIGFSTGAYGNPSLVRLDPNLTSSYTVVPVDSELSAVSELGGNTPPFSATLPTRLYAVGDRRAFPLQSPQNNPFLWMVRTSTDGGDSWTGIGGDTFQLNSKESAGANGFAADANGNVYTCGNAYLKNVPHWIVRKLPAPSISEPTPAWRTVSDLTGRGGGYANGMCVFPGNSSYPSAVFAVGQLDGNKWEVRRSLDYGVTWVSVDTGFGVGNPKKAACDSAGNIFVVGSAVGVSGSSRWVVRMSSNGGSNWATMLDVQDGFINAARNVTADRQGNIWVAGMTSVGSDKYATRRWTVVRHSPSENWSASWNSRQNSFPGNYSDAFGIAADASGNNVFATGTVQDWTDGNLNFYPGGRLVVQRLLP